MTLDQSLSLSESLWARNTMHQPLFDSLGNSAEDGTDEISVLIELTFWWGETTVNRKNQLAIVNRINRIWKVSDGSKCCKKIKSRSGIGKAGVGAL